MINRIIFILFVFMGLNSFSQKKGTIYCFPGQGSDARIFDSLSIDTSYVIKIIQYGTPEKDMSMSEFAKLYSHEIDTTHDFVLLGVSLGGMICSELNEILNPKKTIIISSAKNINELPSRYNFQKALPVYKLFPGSIILAGAKMLQPIVEPDRKKNKETFKSMLGAKKSTYMRRTVGIIINWDRTENTKKIYHIHGTNDHTIPLKNVVSPDFIINEGSHMMTLTRASEISSVINEILDLKDQ